MTGDRELCQRLKALRYLDAEALLVETLDQLRQQISLLQLDAAALREIRTELKLTSNSPPGHEQFYRKVHGVVLENVWNVRRFTAPHRP